MFDSKMKELEFRTGAIKPIECVKEAFSLIKDEYWVLLVVSIIGAMIAAVSVYILIGAMVCGIFKTYLRKIDGDKVKFDDLWTGFKYFRPSLLVTILIVVPIVVWTAILVVTLYLPLIMQLPQGSGPLDGDEMMRSALIAFSVDAVVALLMVCLHSLLIFCFPLIVDKGISGWDSIKLSSRAVMKNLGGIGGMVAANLGLVMLGFLTCGIGIYAVLPLLTASNLVAYRKVFPKLV